MTFRLTTGASAETQTAISQFEDAETQTNGFGSVMESPTSPLDSSIGSPSLLDPIDDLMDTTDASIMDSDDEATCHDSSLTTHPASPDSAVAMEPQFAPGQFDDAIEPTPPVVGRHRPGPCIWIRTDIFEEYGIVLPAHSSMEEALAASHEALNSNRHNPAVHDGVGYQFPPLDVYDNSDHNSDSCGSWGLEREQ